MKKFFIVLGSVLILLLMYLGFWFYSATDTKNVYLSGYVFDNKTNEPIQNAVIKIKNYHYESNNGITNFSEYLGEDDYKLKSDKNGFYEIKIDKSAFIVVEIKKKNYKLQTDSDYSFKYMTFKTYLKKS